MSVLDQITGLIPITLASGIVLKATEKVLPQQQLRSKRNGKKRMRRTNSPSFGDFSNIGL